MGIQAAIRRNSRVAASVSVTLIAVALLVIIWQTSGNDSGVVDPTRGYFTTDDGATWFQDSIENLPPYMKDGKEAVRAHLFRCEDGKIFAGYLERYTPESKKSIEQARARKAASPQDAQETQTTSAAAVRTEVKKPLDSGAWQSVTGNYAAYSRVVQVKCADGTTNGLDPILR